VTGRRLDLFDALAQPLRDRIHAGELVPGALLPSESELARAAGTKRYSVRKALALLHKEGLIGPIPGRGWAVSALGGVAEEPAEEPNALPRYRQIAAELRAAIETGQLTPGAVLPSESTLIARHQVSRSTVRHALALLESDGLIRTHPGAGRYVRIH
jgi:DNA-binding GntR family transcriptional regulator